MSLFSVQNESKVLLQTTLMKAWSSLCSERLIRLLMSMESNCQATQKTKDFLLILMMI